MRTSRTARCRRCYITHPIIHPRDLLHLGSRDVPQRWIGAMTSLSKPRSGSTSNHPDIPTGATLMAPSGRPRTRRTSNHVQVPLDRQLVHLVLTLRDGRDLVPPSRSWYSYRRSPSFRLLLLFTPLLPQSPSTSTSNTFQHACLLRCPSPRIRLCSLRRTGRQTPHPSCCRHRRRHPQLFVPFLPHLGMHSLTLHSPSDALTLEVLRSTASPRPFVC